jgi:anti-sigma B factor antagonist
MGVERHLSAHKGKKPVFIVRSPKREMPPGGFAAGRASLKRKRARAPMPPANVRTTVRQVNATTSIIDIEGEISAFAEQALMDAYTQANGATTRAFILNLSRLEYMNSGGIGLLVTLLIRIKRQKQRLLVCGLSDHYQHIFELTRLNEAIGIYASEAAALVAAGAA